MAVSVHSWVNRNGPHRKNEPIDDARINGLSTLSVALERWLQQEQELAQHGVGPIQTTIKLDTLRKVFKTKTEALDTRETNARNANRNQA